MRTKLKNRRKQISKDLQENKFLLNDKVYLIYFSTHVNHRTLMIVLQGVRHVLQDEQELPGSRRKEERGREEEKGEGENCEQIQIKIRGCS